MSVLIVHGGAGDIPDSRVPLKLAGVKLAVRRGYEELIKTGNVLNAVEIAVNVMEDDPAFNCGYGSVLTSKGEVEQDALIIKGSDLSAGAVGEIKHFKHPISLARVVMEKTPHSFLVGAGAEEIGLQNGIQLVSNESLIAPAALAAYRRYLESHVLGTNELGGKQFGTVGAVAINENGEIAAATSTGGISGKLPGRIGDTPIIGGGTFASDSSCGASATGLGEAIMKSNLASRIAHRIEGGTRPSTAITEALEYMTSKIPEANRRRILQLKGEAQMAKRLFHLDNPGFVQEENTSHLYCFPCTHCNKSSKNGDGKSTPCAKCYFGFSSCPTVWDHIISLCNNLLNGYGCTSYMSHICDLEADAGVIIITKDAEPAFAFNSRRMAWAYGRSLDGQLHYGIERGEDYSEPI